MLVIQLRVESVVVTYDECQVQVICLVIQPFQHLVQMGKCLPMTLFNRLCDQSPISNQNFEMTLAMNTGGKICGS